MSQIEALIRREVGQVIELDIESLSGDSNLIAFGLHSLAMLRIVEILSRLAGVRVDYADVARCPTLRGWSDLIGAVQKLKS